MKRVLVELLGELISIRDSEETLDLVIARLLQWSEGRTRIGTCPSGHGAACRGRYSTGTLRPILPVDCS